jgi:hypothetical protein
MQLSAKALLKPFSTPTKDIDDSSTDDEDLKGDLKMIEDDEDSGSDAENNEDEDSDEDSDVDDVEDPLDVLDEEHRKKLLEDTLAVRTTLDKVCSDISTF